MKTNQTKEDEQKALTNSESIELFQSMENAGMEQVTQKDLLLPRIKILQKMSPEIDRQKPEFISGAKEGDIIDTGLGINFKEEINFLPCLYRKLWIEWFPRSEAKGIANTYENQQIIQYASPDENGRLRLPNGNSLVETSVFYGFLQFGQELHESFISLSGTQLRKSRQWLTLAKGERVTGSNGTFTPPLFYRFYRLGTAYETNKMGGWYGWTVSRGQTLLNTIPPSELNSIIEMIKEFQSNISEMISQRITEVLPGETPKAIAAPDDDDIPL